MDFHQAIAGYLRGQPQLVALVNGIYAGHAPQGILPPYITYREPSTVPMQWTTSAECGFMKATLQIDVVVRSAADPLGDVLANINAEVLDALKDFRGVITVGSDELVVHDVQRDNHTRIPEPPIDGSDKPWNRSIHEFTVIYEGE